MKFCIGCNRIVYNIELSNSKSTFSVFTSHLKTRRAGRILSLVMQTRDVVKGLYNFQEFS